MSKKNKRSKKNNQAQVIVKKKGGFFRTLFTLLLGFILGMVGLVGGIAGAGYWAVTRPIEQVDETIGKLGLDVDLSEYLTDEYYKNTVLYLIGDVSDAVAEIAGGEGTFNSLASISPAVVKAMDKLAEKMVELGSTMTKDNISSLLLETKFADFGTVLKDQLLGSIQIGNLLVGVNAFPFDVLVNDVMMMSILYGVEGVDYTVDTENQKILPVAGGKEFLSVGSIMNNGITATLGDLPIDALLTINEGDGVLCALAYGPSHKYTFAEGKVQMNELVYTLNGGELFLDGEALTSIYAKDGSTVEVEYTLVEGKTDEYNLIVRLTDTASNEQTVVASQYLKATSATTFDVYTNAEMTKKATYSKTTIGNLMDGAQGLLEDIELASVLDLETASNPILFTLAYGVEGEDFYYDADGKVQMYEGKKPKTIGSLMNGSELDSLITDLPLATILTGIDHEDGMMMALAYGAASHWDIVEDEVVMNKVVYTIDGTQVYDIDGALVEDMTATLSGGVYTLTRDLGNGQTTTTYAKQVSGEDYCYEYPTAECVLGDEIKYSKTTVGDLQSNPTDLLNAIQLADIMSVEYGTTNSILIALAYGVEGKDYTVVNNEIVPITPPKTVGSLMSGDLEETIETLPLDALLTVPLDDEMMIALAYGKKDTHFVINKNNSTNASDWEVEMLGSFYTLEQRDEDTQAYFYNKNDDKVNGVIASDNANYEYMIDGEEKIYLKATNATFPNRYYLFNANGEEIPFEKITIAQLQSNPDDLINGIELAGVLNIESPLDEDASRLMRALAYGNKGTHYEVVNGQVVWLNGNGPRTIGSLRDGGALFNDLLIGDALDVKAGAHPVLIAIAYGEEYTVAPDKFVDAAGNEVTEFTASTVSDYDYEFVSGGSTVYLKYNASTKNYDAYNESNQSLSKSYTFKKGEDIISSENRTLNDLSGENSMNIINGVSLASALNVAADDSSDSLMRALAYGTQGTHYDFATDGTLYMLPSFYTLKNGQYYDKNNQVVTVSPTDKSDYVGEITLNDKTVYIKASNPDYADRFYAYDEDGNAVNFKKATIGDLSSSGSGLINNVTLADALGLTQEDIENGGLTVSLAFDKHGNAYTIGQLSEDPNAIINNITLADALGLSANSTDKMMLSLAYGQAGTHYTIITDGETKKIDMLPSFYTLEDDVLYDRFNGAVDKTATEGEYAYTITLDGETVYLKASNADYPDRYYAYDANGNAVDFKETSIGDLSANGTGVVHSVTLADTLGVEKGDTSLSGALAFDKQGNAYTIGQLAKDPTAIVNNIQLDKVMPASNNNDALTMYLLYGRSELHYHWDDTNKQAVMLEMVMAIHEYEGALCLHNEFGEAIDGATLIEEAPHEPITWTDKNGEECNATVYYTFTRHGVEHRLILPDDTNKLPMTESIRLKGKGNYDGYYGAVYYVQYNLGTTDAPVWTNELYEPNTIGDLTQDGALLSNLTNRLTLAEVLGESTALRENIFLAPIADTSIGELPQAISELTIAEVFEDDVFKKVDNSFVSKDGTILFLVPDLSSLDNYKGNIVERDSETSIYYYKDPNGKHVKAGDYVDEFGNKQDRALVGTWYYLLTDGDTSDGYTAPEDYLLTEIAALVNNMTANIQNASLNELQTNGILSLSNDTFLTTDIMYKLVLPITVETDYPIPTITYTYENTIYDTDNGEGFYFKDEDGTNGALKQKFGDLTIKELVDYVTTLLGRLAQNS